MLCSEEIFNEVNGMMNRGYSIEKLPNDDRVWIEIILHIIEGVESEYQALDDEDYDNMTTLDKLKADIATEVVEDIKTSLKCNVVDLVYGIEDEEEE